MYRARVGDVVEYRGYVGIIHAVIEHRNDEERTVKLDWVAGINPDCDFRDSHPDADWYPVNECERDFQLICNVYEK